MSCSLTCDGDNITCPKCETKYGIAWHNATESGQVEIGSHIVTCPKCGKKIVFACWVEYKVYLEI